RWRSPQFSARPVSFRVSDKQPSNKRLERAAGKGSCLRRRNTRLEPKALRASAQPRAVSSKKRGIAESATQV
ncbi:MAG: hypothetical protein AB7P17_12425, partial [Nitrospirales bacterium]